MHLRTDVYRIVLAISSVALQGCTATTEFARPIPSALVGTWVGETLQHSPRGTTTLALEIKASGRFTWSVRTTGLYAGQAPTELTGSSREVGRLSTIGQRAIFRSDSVYEISGPDRIESVRWVKPSSGGFGSSALFDSAEYRVRDDVLELNYLSYPADSPVPTFRRFVRVR